jgi:hypothetical protein
MFKQSGRRTASVQLTGWLLVALLAVPATIAAQKPPLADVAKKEQERRKTGKDAPKKLTNKDLPESAQKPQGPVTSPADPAAGQAAAPGEPGAAAGTEKPAGAAEEKTESWWRNRMAQAREELRRNEAFLEALQSRVNGLTTDFVNRDDPAQRAKIAEDRQKALNEMERLKAEIAAGRKRIEDIEEEARKAAVPPGWLR